MNLTPAPVTDPLYYLHNALLVIDWVLAHHADLLLEDEVALLQQIKALDQPAQALLFRLMMRRGELFRSDALSYPEAEPIDQSLNNLYRYLMVDLRPVVDVKQLGQVCRKAELYALSQSLLPDLPLKKSTSKAILQTQFETHFGDEQRHLSEWWPEVSFTLIKLELNELFERVRLLFFGNLYQDWSEFVVTELGYQRYESVAFTSESRAFQYRLEVDRYLLLHQLQKCFDQGETVEQVFQQIERVDAPQWLADKSDKLLFQLGRQAEREKDFSLAQQIYADCQNPEARVRELRVFELLQQPQQGLEHAEQVLATLSQPELRLAAQRIQQRLAKKLGESVSKAVALNTELSANALATEPLPTQKLVLSRVAEQPVEAAVIDYLAAQGKQAFHVESRLFNALFALHFWPAIFAPVRGAYFHPFQDKPADLYREGFAELRAVEIAAGFKLLAEGKYVEQIQACYQQKLGTACRLIHWPSISEMLLQQSLAQIPAEHLKAVFEYLLLDLRNHRRGLPDLIVFDQEAGQYELIEVKGPGDRLQDHQRLWLEYLHAHGVSVAVCHVVWDD